MIGIGHFRWTVIVIASYSENYHTVQATWDAHT